MKAIEFITERATSILFHYTNLNGAYGIISSKSFNFNGSQSDYMIRKGYEYYMSAARSPQTYYQTFRTRSNMFLFVLNGDWFNRHPAVIVKPIEIDNFDHQWDDNIPLGKRDLYNRRKRHFDDRSAKSKSTSMFEDRIWSKVERLRIDEKAIKELHFVYKFDDQLENFMHLLDKKFHRLLDPPLDLKWWRYEDADDLKLRNKKKAIDSYEIRKNNGKQEYV